MEIPARHRTRLRFTWLIVFSGLAVVLVEKFDFKYAGQLSLVARSVFWTSVIAYLSYRVYHRLRRDR